jgi:hypothetical protein
LGTDLCHIAAAIKKAPWERGFWIQVSKYTLAV